jgi:hypothetical protein
MSLPAADVASDDDVPIAVENDELAASAQEPQRRFEGLHSVLCAYKDGKLKPGSVNLPFDICAELCRDEAELTKAWPPEEKARLLPCVVSALRLVYPNKRVEWFDKPFLSDANAATAYWCRVLLRRAEIWDAAAARLESQRASLRRVSLQCRIKEKIAQRKAERLSSICKSSSARYVYKTPAKQTIVSLSSSDSDCDDRNVIDISISP